MQTLQEHWKTYVVYKKILGKICYCKKGISNDFNLYDFSLLNGKYVKEYHIYV